MIGDPKPYSAMNDTGVKWLGEVPERKVTVEPNQLSSNQLVIFGYFKARFTRDCHYEA